MRSLYPFIAILTAYCMIPGSGEVIENAIHLIESGHLAHALDDEEHERHGDEHGCSGTSHVCRCCPSPVFLRTKPIPTISSAHPEGETVSLDLDDLLADGYHSGVFRPPIA